MRKDDFNCFAKIATATGAKTRAVCRWPNRLSRLDDDQRGGLWMCPAWPTSGRRPEKGDRKFVTAMGEFATVTDFVAGARVFGGRKRSSELRLRWIVVSPDR